MNEKVYNVLIRLPIFGPIFESFTEPIGLFGSNEMSSGYTDHILSLFHEYRKTHPNVKLTRQLIEKLLSDNKKS